jgi:hypothetical protein
MKILKAVRRFSSWICGLFRKKPVYVTRHFWDAQLGCEVEGYVPQGVLYPNMRIAEALDAIRHGARISRKDRTALRAQAEYMFGRENLKESEG